MNRDPLLALQPSPNLNEQTLSNADNDDFDSHIIVGATSGMRTLSGVQPSGELHIGNYFGAIAQHIFAQEHNESFFFIANYHAMTTARQGVDLRISSRNVALDYLGLGLNPTKAALYRQTDVAGVTQLSWVLSCLCSVGDLERSVAYKDKIAKGLTANAGLFTYPVLMAADILMVDAQAVPVGQDQTQNVELARRLGARFNDNYGSEVFTIPKAQLNDSATVPGKDGQKMSKSYGNTIPIFCSADEYKRHVFEIATSSAGVADVKDPNECTAFGLLSLVAPLDEASEWAERYQQGGLRYVDVKNRLAQLLEERFGAARKRRADYAQRPDDVEDILREGAQRANDAAGPILAQVFDLTGLGSRAAFIPVSGATFVRSRNSWS
jgi:tryptophanyl-tRNA synthetase